MIHYGSSKDEFLTYLSISDDLPTRYVLCCTEKFSIIESNVDVCNIILAASLHLVGNIIDPKTNKIDEDFRYCNKFDVFQRVKFSPGLRNCLDLDFPPGLLRMAVTKIEGEGRHSF